MTAPNTKRNAPSFSTQLICIQATINKLILKFKNKVFKAKKTVHKIRKHSKNGEQIKTMKHINTFNPSKLLRKPIPNSTQNLTKRRSEPKKATHKLLISLS